eukprot:TRINITY_DN100670_c0_g1_i1.p1 TRINITY_DN100670_c0_g1~~TRINITY_DN100670_c0_g1_i1.p1  ORF type:complete len:694 (-),score=125.83 TRINITY_DN100670_c0_g1_i1:164-2245(-)
MLGLLARSRAAFESWRLQAEAPTLALTDGAPGLLEEEAGSGKGGACDDEVLEVSSTEAPDATLDESEDDTSAGAVCPRCLCDIEESAADALCCVSCGDNIHAACLYPPVPAKLHGSSSRLPCWKCDTCLQEDRLCNKSDSSGHYDICMACLKFGRQHGGDLERCLACRGSFHRRCFSSALAPGLCPSCDDAQRQSPVQLQRWTLELVPQGDRSVPVVQGWCEAGDDTEGCWRSSEIVHVVSPTLLVTRSRVVVKLVGVLSKKAARTVRLPPPLARYFSAGFPVAHWRLLVRYADGQMPEEVQAALHGEPTEAVAASSETALALLSAGTIASHADAAHGYDASRKKAASSQARRKSTDSREPERRQALHDPAARAALTVALGEVRPSTPNFWLAVAARMAMDGFVLSPEDCRDLAFGEDIESQRPVQRERPSKRLTVAQHAPLLPLQLPESLALALPESSRTRRVSKNGKAALHAQAFGDREGDFFALAPASASSPTRKRTCSAQEASSPAAEKSAALPDDLLSSPGMLDFLSSLHTGLSPPREGEARPAKRTRSRKPLALEAPPALLALPWTGNAAVGASEGGANPAWEPKGLDSFVLKARSSRGSCGITQAARRGGIGADLAATVRRGNTEQKALDLLREEDERRQLRREALAACDDCEGGDNSDPTLSEDEMAPLPSMPPVLGGADSAEWM